MIVALSCLTRTVSPLVAAAADTGRDAGASAVSATPKTEVPADDESGRKAAGDRRQPPPDEAPASHEGETAGPAGAQNEGGEGWSEPVTKGDMLSFRTYTVALGLVVNAAAVGLHVEYRFIPYIGLKFMLLDVFGLALEEGSKTLDVGEFLIAGLLAPTLHIPLRRNLLDPYLFCGMLYSNFHWIHSKSDREGDIRDLTIAGGVGMGVRITDYLDLGINIWCNYDYRVDWTDTAARKGSRIVMVLPYFSVKLLF